ncbi:GTP-binding protein [Streptomyces sp. ISL-10]|uniref:CobW family GTP-binding protein n=1 Tax=Streptomyces sp. ISL-10 TaxID=2819172 RepID=UPI001BE6D05C|nr:GTP-binding protein [Streptomyces sp. ISL-10]MBT2363846.1 GTP-binding protein [Streptomyces sp. ISL-10]
MSPTRPQIPVVVLAGFLGSGKTTLLNHLLRRNGGNRIGVVVNDFGSIEIDAMTVAGQVGSTISLGNGCLCCAVDASELDDYLDKLTRPSARIDVIVVEASGLAEPQELVRMILASDNPRIVYGGLAEVVDAAEFDAIRARHPEIDRHLAIADLVVLNKTDRVGGAGLERLRDTLAQLAGGTPVVSAQYGRIDPELLLDPAVRPERDEKVRQLSFEDLYAEAYDREHSHEHAHESGHEGHLHTAYDSVSVALDVPVHPRRLMTFLDSRPAGLYRIKGFVDFGAADPRNRYAVHAVGRFLRFYPQPWPAGADPRTQLVLIGSGIDAEGLRKEVESCALSGSDDLPDERSMWGVLRYVPREADGDEAPGEPDGTGAPDHDI